MWLASFSFFFFPLRASLFFCFIQIISYRLFYFDYHFFVSFIFPPSTATVSGSRHTTTQRVYQPLSPWQHQAQYSAAHQRRVGDCRRHTRRDCSLGYGCFSTLNEMFRISCHSNSDSDSRISSSVANACSPFWLNARLFSLIWSMFVVVVGFRCS